MRAWTSLWHTLCALLPATAYGTHARSALAIQFQATQVSSKSSLIMIVILLLSREVLSTRVVRRAGGWLGQRRWVSTCGEGGLAAGDPK